MKYPGRFEQLLLQRQAQPFAWGVSDCAMWAFDAVLVSTGRDPVPDVRGTYSTALAAARRLRLEGGWPAVCAARIGRAVMPDEAQDGDVAQVHPAHCAEEMAAVGALAVVWRGQLVAQGAQGLVQLPLSAALGVWRPQ